MLCLGVGGGLLVKVFHNDILLFCFMRSIVTVARALKI